MCQQGVDATGLAGLVSAFTYSEAPDWRCVSGPGLLCCLCWG